MSRAMLALGGLAAFLLVSSGPPLKAAELTAPTRVAHVRARMPAQCGPCGCLRVTYVRHRDLQSTYGLSYDPRNYDQTEPHFYLGRSHAYPRYSVEGGPVAGSC